MLPLLELAYTAFVSSSCLVILTFCPCQGRESRFLRPRPLYAITITVSNTSEILIQRIAEEQRRYTVLLLYLDIFPTKFGQELSNPSDCLRVAVVEPGLQY